MMKRILALLLSIAMLVSVGAFAAEIAEEGFPDVSDEHANSEAIKYYTEAGVINGYPDGSFGPDKPITRGEFVKMLMVYAGNEKVNTEGVVTGFPDVDGAEGKEAHWAHPFIKTAVDLKIVNGYPDGTFRPDDNVKYEEALKMMVCYLGGEDAAKDKVKGTTYDVYPEGYIRVANEKLMNRNLASALGEHASRADVAQILFNSKEIKTLKPTTNVPIIIGGGSGGGGGGGGVTYTLDQSISMGRNWTGSRDGIVVAAAKIDSNDKKQQYFLEGNGTGIVTREGLRDTISAYQLIVKMDITVAGCNYLLFTNDSRNKTYYDYLGHHVSINFTYNGSRNAFLINSISSIQENDTIGSVSGDIILKGKTDAYNASQTENYGIVYYVAKDDKEVTLKLPRELNGINIIYNERLVDTNVTPITIADLIPKNGTISYVKADRHTYRLIRVTDTETFVAGTIKTTVPRGIDDKYRKQTGSTTPVHLTLDDRDESGINLTIKSSTGTEMTVASIRKGNILVVTKSKCGTYVDVTVHTKTLTNQKIVGISDEEGIAFESDRLKYYKYSDYYNTYVKHNLDIDLADRVTVCLNAAGEIVWLEETEPVYKIGYLKSAVVNTTQEPNVIDVKIITGGSTPIEIDRKITNTTKVGTPSVTGETYVAGEKTKYSDMNELLDLLKAKAAVINSGKSGYSINAAVAQPIRYVDNGNNIELLETMVLDIDNKFTGTALTYSAGTNGKFSGTNTQYSASSDATYIFVPNDRTSWAANIYKMGTASQVSSKLINYGKYNVEPYFVPNASGGFTRKVFVIYNENIEAQPNYRSETIVVDRKQQTLNSGTAVYTIYPKSGYGNSKSSYNTVSLTSINAYVLDSNFQRMTDENGAYVRREVMPGDVIRFGYAPGGAIMNIEILFDISEALESRKGIAYDNRGNTIELDDVEFEEPYYYGRTGLIINIPNNPEYCRLSIGNGHTSDLFVGSNYASQRVLLNTYDEDELSITLESKTMADLNEGDMVYVWQNYSNGLVFKYIYAVRYETDLMSQYDAENTPAPEPGTGGETTEPGEGEDPSQSGNDGTTEPGEGEDPSQPGNDGTTEPGEGEDPSQPSNDGTTEPGEGEDPSQSGSEETPGQDEDQTDPTPGE